MVKKIKQVCLLQNLAQEVERPYTLNKRVEESKNKKSLFTAEYFMTTDI